MRCSHHGLIDLSLRGRRHHHKTLNTCNLCRNGIHQHRGRIGRAAAGHINTSRINRAPARTQPHTFLVAIVAILGQLRLVIGLDALCREFQGIAQFGRQRLIGCLAFLRRNLPALLAEAETIKALGQFQKGYIAARAHIADCLLDDCRHIGLGLATTTNQLVKLAVEIRLADRKPKH